MSSFRFFFVDFHFFHILFDLLTVFAKSFDTGKTRIKELLFVRQKFSSQASIYTSLQYLACIFVIVLSLTDETFSFSHHQVLLANEFVLFVV